MVHIHDSQPVREPAPPAGPIPGPDWSFEQASFEELLFLLCRRASGDVHLDLGELDRVDVAEVSTLLRAGSTMPTGWQLVLHNVPAEVRRMIDALRPEGTPFLRVD